MIKGTKVKVVYNDGERIRVKDLIFERKEEPFVIFINANNKEEQIHQDIIKRMEAAKWQF